MDNLDKLIKENKDDVQVSEKVHKKVEATLDIIMKEDIKKEVAKVEKKMKKRMFNVKKASLVASITLAVLISLGAKYDVYAKIGDLMKSFEKQGDVAEKVELYANIIEKNVSDNGYRVNIESIMTDSHTIRLFYDITSEKDEKQKPGIWGDKMSIDGKDIKEWGGGAGEEHYVQDDNKKWSGTMVIMRFEKELPKSFNFKWNINNISDHKGQWDFDINVDGEKIAKETKTIDVNKESKLQFGEFKVNKVEASPIEIKLQTDQGINDEIMNKLGKRQRGLEWYSISYIVVDENEKIISPATSDYMEWWYGSSYSKNKDWSYKVKDKIPSKIKIIPYDRLNDFNNSIVLSSQYDIGTKDTSLYKGENGSLDIKSIEDKGKLVEVTVKISGYLRFELLNNLSLIKEEEKNNMYPRESMMLDESRKSIGENINNDEFILKFSKFNGKNKKYCIRFKAGHDGEAIDKMYKIYEDKAIEVDLSK